MDKLQEVVNNQFFFIIFVKTVRFARLTRPLTKLIRLKGKKERGVVVKTPEPAQVRIVLFNLLFFIDFSLSSAVYQLDSPRQWLHFFAYTSWLVVHWIEALIIKKNATFLAVIVFSATPPAGIQAVFSEFPFHSRAQASAIFAPTNFNLLIN